MSLLARAGAVVLIAGLYGCTTQMPSRSTDRQAVSASFRHAETMDKDAQLPRQLIVVATRRSDKAPVFFTNGNTGVAVRASSAVAGIFSPVGIQGTEYEDGDESLPLAVRAARQAGARFVIAIDVTPRPETEPLKGSVSGRQRLATRRARIAPEAALAD